MDPLIWDPILLRGTFKELYSGIYFLDPSGGLGKGDRTFPRRHRLMAEY